MQWYNEPPQWKTEDKIIQVTTRPKSDFWRVTHYDFIRDNGHFYYEEIKGNFVVSVKFTGHYQDLYDQAGLMLRVDENNWIKCGIEYVEGVQNISAVVTRDYSDWSVVPLSQSPSTVWLRASRRKEAVEISYSFDNQQYTMLRLAYLVPAQITQVGPMCASPDGNGYSVTFEDFAIQPLK
jgi:regulation of enolase protein 1 (concanavalin A-like superfamily)